MSADLSPFPVENEYLLRSALRVLFQAALEEPVYTGTLYHLIGQGGIGKSHELRLLHEQAFALHNDRAQQLIETGIIDLAHTRYQQPLLLMDTLARRITRSLTGTPSTPGYFDGFFQAADRYLMAGGEDAKVQQLVRSAFLQDYQTATRDHRVVITLDTFERLDPRIPEVERFNFRGPGRLETWLIDLLAELPRSLIVIAGRARRRQADRLRQQFGPSFARRLALAPFSVEETKAFVERQNIPEERRDLAWYELMFKVSGGLPVRLIVAIEIARACAFDPDLLPLSLRDPTPDKMRQLGEDFARSFVEALHNSNPPLALLIEQAYYLRKGLHPDLLKHLAKVEGDRAASAEIDTLLTTFAQFGFVKVSGDKVLTLHDDVYDLLRDGLGTGSAARWHADTIAYLDQEQVRLHTEIGREGMTIKRLGQLRMVQVDRLYYQLSREPLLRGYQDYCELAYSAIFARDEEFDTQLQDELARFFDHGSTSGRASRKQLEKQDFSWQRICGDEAVRWVFRRIHAAGLRATDSPLALDLAAEVQHAFSEFFTTDPLLHAALETVRLEELGFRATTPTETDAVVARYAALTESLAASEAQAASEAAERPIYAYRRQQSRFLRAYALNNWGYIERCRLRINTAVAHYSEAIELYKTLGNGTAILRATSLNNLGYALFLQGDIELGLVCIQEALGLQRRAGARYREAVSYNTQGRLLLDLDDVTGVQRSAGYARALLNDFIGSRNDALCAIVEGNLQRWIAYRSRDDVTQSEATYTLALERYAASLAYFDAQKGEPDRKAEVRQGLGCAHRSRGYVRRLRGDDRANADMEQADSYFRAALALLPEDEVALCVSLHEDIAVAYVNQERYTDALRELDRAEQLLPPAFAVRPRAGAVETAETREQQRLWLECAKVELQRALCKLGMNEPVEACAALLRAFACLLRFSPESQELRTFRIVARQYLLQRYRDHTQSANELRALREKTYLISRQLGTREAFFELDHIFGTVERMLKLL